MNEYVIADEPRPGLQQKFIVNPILPLFYFMFGVSLLAWIWLAFNSQAMGSGRKTREWLVLAAGLLGAVLLSLVALYLVNAGVVPAVYAKYLIQMVLVWKIFITYWVVMLQYPCHELYLYLHPDQSKNNIGVVIFMALIFLSYNSSSVQSLEFPLWLKIALG